MLPGGPPIAGPPIIGLPIIGFPIIGPLIIGFPIIGPPIIGTLICGLIMPGNIPGPAPAPDSSETSLICTPRGIKNPSFQILIIVSTESRSSGLSGGVRALRGSYSEELAEREPHLEPESGLSARRRMRSSKDSSLAFPVSFLALEGWSGRT